VFKTQHKLFGTIVIYYNKIQQSNVDRLLIFMFRFSTPLHLAVLVHNDDIFTLLLDEHARSSKIDLNAQTVDDHTPLYYALINTLKLDTDDSFANRLVTAGANPNPVSTFRCIVETRN